MIQPANLLGRCRRAAGLRQDEVAAVAGVDQSMVSVYEHGRRDPTWPTLRRLIGATGHVVVPLALPLPHAGPPPLETLATEMTGGTDDQRIRAVLSFVDWYRATPGDRRALLAEEPLPTGDVRWDALLGGLAEHLALADAVDPPEWAFAPERFLAAAWYWIDLPSVRRRCARTTPAAFRRRHIWIDAADLERA